MSLFENFVLNLKSFSNESQHSKFDEMIKRIPESKRLIIYAQLQQITAEDLISLKVTMLDPIHLLVPKSIIHHEFFPYIALKSFHQQDISAYEFGSLMRLWGSLKDICPQPGDTFEAPKFIPLFGSDGARNSLAVELLLSGLQPTILPNLVKKKPQELLDEIYNNAGRLSPSEQGLWLVQNTTDKTRYKDFPLPTNNISQYMNSLTITQRLKSVINFHYLALPQGSSQEIIPSFGLQQAFLNAAFPHAVHINPVIGASSVDHIRFGGNLRRRDVALPFPGNDLPNLQMATLRLAFWISFFMISITV